MANKIQFRRGLKAALPTLSVGEPAFCTDSDELFIGDGTTNIQLAKQNDIITPTERTKLAGIATGAQVNQNAFANVKVGATTLAADSTTDTLELVAGTDITLTPDATNDKVTINANVPVKSVSGKTGAVTLTKSDVGLSNVDNTSDLNKPISTAVQTALNSKVSQADFNEHLAEYATTNDLTYYVNPATGNDTNDGLTSGTAFRTIQKAMNLLPYKIDHVVTINVLAGTSTEDVIIAGFGSGKGSINVKGATTLAQATNYKVGSITVEKCSIPIFGTGIEATRSGVAGAHGFVINFCKFVKLDSCRCVTADVNNAGVCAINTPTVVVSNGEFSNRYAGVYGAQLAVILSAVNVGTGNTFGLASVSGSVINKNNTQPSGTTAEYANGGVIR